MMGTLVQVALGGAIGASLRYLAGVATIRLLGPGFPWATIFVNVVGSLVMGAVFVVLAHKDATRMAPFLMTGLLGGFTTFSAFSFDALTLFHRGETLHAAAYVLGSVVLALGGIVLGQMIARAMLA